jgi:hypothetical protein
MYGANMNKILATALALGTTLGGSVAAAASNEDVLARLAALEQENAAIRKENAALRENKRLRQQNTSLKSESGTPAQVVAKNTDPFAAYAADLPATYKARPLEAPSQLRVWGEGGAIFSGGDPASQNYSFLDFTTTGFLAGGGGGTLPGQLDLTPKTGWEAAAGFDYRFADSPWHVSGQFRIYQGSASGSASTAGSLDPSILAVLDPAAFAAGAGSSGNQSFTANNKERHWLADIAIGREVLGSGAAAMQVKAGLRVVEFEQTRSSVDTLNILTNFGLPLEIEDGIFITSTAHHRVGRNVTRSRFLGAGPRIGVEGSVPLAGGWAFDYLADAAVLFGSQRVTSDTSSVLTTSPAVMALVFGGTNSSTSVSDQRFATVFNADMQVGVSYWMTQNVKLSASYRLDAYFNVLNHSLAPTVNQSSDRYIHGPRLGVSATF